jgi:thiol-disulfide isomerase/thioredoxin
MRFFYSVILCLVLTATSAPVLNAVGNEQVQKGIQGLEAPPLGVKNWIQLPQGKETLDIFDYRGKTVFMLLFQDTCEACHKRAFPTLKILADKFGDTDKVAFLAIQTPFEEFSDNTESKIQSTAEKFGLTIPFGHLTKTPGFYSVNTAYKTGGTPWWVIVNPEGKVDYNGFYLNPDVAVENLEKILDGEPIN